MPPSFPLSIAYSFLLVALNCSVSHSTSFGPNSFARECLWQQVVGLGQGDFWQTINTGPSQGHVSDILWSPRVRVIFLMGKGVRARFYLSSRLPHTFPPSVSPRITGLYLCACSLQATPLPQTVYLSAGQALRAEATAVLTCPYSVMMWFCRTYSSTPSSSS